MTAQLLAITDPRCPASTRYRVTQFEALLASQGVNVETLDFPGRDAVSAKQTKDALFDRIAKADAVVFQRCLPDASLLREIRRRARRLLFDFDDAIIYSESTRAAPRRRLRTTWRFRRMMRCCDGVTAGNSYLADLARSHGAGTVEVIPTAVEMARYEGASGESRNDSSNGAGTHSAANAAGPAAGPVAGPVIGWIGSRSTLPYLESLRAPLERLSKQIPGLTVRVIADRYPNLGRTPTEWIPWRPDTEIQELKRLRIGLAPLPDDRWTRGKCGLRLLQYLAAGVPAVASPVGTQAEVTAADAALAAGSEADWFGAMQSILSDENLAAGLAERGRNLARRRFDAAGLSGALQAAWCGKS